MRTLRICPKCLYILDSMYPTNGDNCPYCNTILESTNVVATTDSAKKSALQVKYSGYPRFDKEAERRRIKQELVERGVFTQQEVGPTLIECPVCHGKVSSSAPACPHCGQPIYTAPTRNVPKCPTCGSTNIRNIGTVERGVSLWAVGLMSSKIGKQYECWQCRHKW